LRKSSNPVLSVLEVVAILRAGWLEQAAPPAESEKRRRIISLSVSRVFMTGAPFVRDVCVGGQIPLSSLPAKG
jgi:hypothetical protein